ncbi:MAG: CsbD family protein [Alphaproteobacteria bacterium]
MDWDQAAGDWTQFKGLLKEQWGDLTDDDLTRIAGKRQQLVGCLQERYKLSESQAEEAIAAFEMENP